VLEDEKIAYPHAQYFFHRTFTDTKQKVDTRIERTRTARGVERFADIDDVAREDNAAKDHRNLRVQLRRGNLIPDRRIGFLWLFVFIFVFVRLRKRIKAVQLVVTTDDACQPCQACAVTRQKCFEARVVVTAHVVDRLRAHLLSVRATVTARVESARTNFTNTIFATLPNFSRTLHANALDAILFLSRSAFKAFVAAIRTGMKPITN
jgi:hypothetical protein